jgi:hypothetical protein
MMRRKPATHLQVICRFAIALAAIFATAACGYHTVAGSSELPQNIN